MVNCIVDADTRLLLIIQYNQNKMSVVSFEFYFGAALTSINIPYGVMSGFTMMDDPTKSSGIKLEYPSRTVSKYICTALHMIGLFGFVYGV